MSTESTTQSTTITSSTTSSTIPPTTVPFEGWSNWSTWTDCSVSCGAGQVARSRKCTSYVPGDEIKACEGYSGSDEIEVADCAFNTCKSGYRMIRLETDKANDHGVIDNLFLSRYPQVVTSNGEVINSDNVSSTGYGAWRLTRYQFEEIISASTLATKSISNNLISNVNVSLT